MNGRGRVFLRGALVALSVVLLLCLVCLARRRNLLLVEWRGVRAKTPSFAGPSETEVEEPPQQGEAASSAARTVVALREELGELDAQAETFRETIEWLRESAQLDEVPDMARLKAEDPVEYDFRRRMIAFKFHKARRRRALREAYLQRLDLTLLTEEERREFQALVAETEAEEARFLQGELVDHGEADDLAELIQRRRSKRRTVLAMMADKAQWGGTAVWEEGLRAVIGLLDTEGLFISLDPNRIRGDFVLRAKETDEETGETRPLNFRVQVEPGWRFEAQEP